LVVGVGELCDFVEELERKDNWSLFTILKKNNSFDWL
jgi:hypothetical protein